MLNPNYINSSLVHMIIKTRNLHDSHTKTENCYTINARCATRNIRFNSTSQQLLDSSQTTKDFSNNTKDINLDHFRKVARALYHYISYNLGPIFSPDELDIINMFIDVYSIKFNKPCYDNLQEVTNYNRLHQNVARILNYYIHEKNFRFSPIDTTTFNQFITNENLIKKSKRGKFEDFCINGVECKIWNCRFAHPFGRIICKCSSLKCPKLHKWQSLCKNKDHKHGSDECGMAHDFSELRSKMKQYIRLHSNMENTI